MNDLMNKLKRTDYVWKTQLPIKKRFMSSKYGEEREM